MAKKTDKNCHISVANLRPDAAVKHGLRGTLSPERWAPEWAQPYAERVNELMTLEHIDPELDRGLMALIARTETMLGKAYAWVGEHGLVSKSGRMRPVVGHIGKLERDLASYYTRAALSPASRRQLGMGAQRQGIAELLSDAEVETVDSKDTQRDPGDVIVDEEEASDGDG